MLKLDSFFLVVVVVVHPKRSIFLYVCLCVSLFILLLFSINLVVVCWKNFQFSFFFLTGKKIKLWKFSFLIIGYWGNFFSIIIVIDIDDDWMLNKKKLLEKTKTFKFIWWSIFFCFIYIDAMLIYREKKIQNSKKKSKRNKKKCHVYCFYWK